MGKKVLIVDDEPNIVISLEYLMKKEGFEVAVAGDGEAPRHRLTARLMFSITSMIGIPNIRIPLGEP